MLLESDLLEAGAEQYILTGSLSSAAIPDSLQSSLLARLDRLPEAREAAQLGAVLGREFSYDMIQSLAAMDDTALQTRLGQLVSHELLYQRGRIPRATYIFRHALIRDAAYASLLRRTRQQIHRQVAELLESTFSEVVETQPERVAYHYTEAGLHELAIAYWRRAGQRESDRSGYREAISHLTTGLTLLRRLPETQERCQLELPLQTALGAASIIVRGYSAPEVEEAYMRARFLCQELGDSQDLFPVLLGLWRFYNTRADFLVARQLGEELLGLAKRRAEPPLYVVAHVTLGATCMQMGEPSQALHHFEEGLAHYTPDQHHFPLFRAGQDPGVACHAFTAWSLWLLGYPDQALVSIHDALELAAELDHPFSDAFALDVACRVYQCRREVQTVCGDADAAVTLSTEQGFALWLAETTCFRGWARVVLGQGEQGLTQMRLGVADCRAAGAEVFAPHLLILLAEGYCHLNLIDEGLGVVKEGLEAVEQAGGHWLQAEVYRLYGELLLRQATPDRAQAETCFHQALEVARCQQAKSLELRASTALLVSGSPKTRVKMPTTYLSRCITGSPRGLIQRIYKKRKHY